MDSDSSAGKRHSTTSSLNDGLDVILNHDSCSSSSGSSSNSCSSSSSSSDDQSNICTGGLKRASTMEKIPSLYMNRMIKRANNTRNK